MINVQNKAIICVARDMDLLEPLLLLINERFGQAYVIELAESSFEVLDIIATLQGIGVKTALVITDQEVLDMSGLALIHLLESKYEAIKFMLLAEEVDVTEASYIINESKVTSLIKKPWDTDALVQMIRNAIRQYDSEVELGRLMTKLRLSEQEKRLILDSIAEAIVYLDLHGNIIWQNHVASTELMHAIDGHVSSRSVLTDLPIDLIFGDKRPYSLEMKVGKDYKLFRYFPVFGRERQPIGIVLIIMDITDRKVSEAMDEAFLEMSRFMNTTESIILAYKQAYKSFKKFFAVELFCVTGKDYDKFYLEFDSDEAGVFSEHQIAQMVKSVRGLLKTNDYQEMVMVYNGEVSIIAYPIRQRVLLLLVKEDLSGHALSQKYINIIGEQLKMGIVKIEHLRKILFQARHDASTGLYNREYFMEQLNMRLSYRRTNRLISENHSVAMIDLNFFKDVNDNYSHLVGDEVLLQIANRLEQALRHGDLVARMGGDEFAILFLNHSKREIVQMIKRLQAIIAKPIELEEATIIIGSSVGIVYDISRYKNGHLILKDADQAMYEAKKDKTGHGSFVFFEKSIQKKIERHDAIEKSLKEVNYEETFDLLYQPVVNLRSREVVGYEAFVRWQEPGRSFLPNEFLPVAEETNDILLIGERVIELAIAALDFMTVDGRKDPFVAINLSSKQLMSKDQMNVIKQAILNHRITSNRLHVDITDRFKDNQLEEAIKHVHELGDYGVHVNLDDFGTGPSSLNLLHRMDIHEIKIDASYVRRIRFDDEALKMVKSIIGLAKALNLTVTAEGVEKKEEEELLFGLGCDQAQGYLYSKPMPFVELHRFEL